MAMGSSPRVFLVAHVGDNMEHVACVSRELDQRTGAVSLPTYCDAPKPNTGMKIGDSNSKPNPKPIPRPNALASSNTSLIKTKKFNSGTHMPRNHQPERPVMCNNVTML